MSNPLPGEVYTDDDADVNDAGCQRQQTIHDCTRHFGW